MFSGAASRGGLIRAGLSGRRCLPLRGKVRAAPQARTGRVCDSLAAACHPVARGRKRRFLATLPCPAGQGALPVCAFDAVCPAGKGAAEWRAVFWRVAKKQGFGAFCPSGNFPRRAGERGNELLPARVGVFPACRLLHVLPMSLSPQETEIRAIPQTECALSPAKPSTFIHPQQMRAFTNRVSSPPRFAANIQRAPKPSFPRLQKAISPPFPPPHPPSSRLPRRRRRTAPARGPSAVYALCRRNRNEAPMPPTRGAWTREHRANGTGRRHCRPGGLCPHPLKGPA